MCRLDADDELARGDRDRRARAAVAAAVRAARPAADARPHARGPRGGLLRGRPHGRPAVRRPPRARPAARLPEPARRPAPAVREPVRDVAGADVARPRVDPQRAPAAARAEGDPHARGRDARASSTAPTPSGSRTTAGGSSTASPPASTRCRRWRTPWRDGARSTSTAASAAARTCSRRSRSARRAAFAARAFACALAVDGGPGVAHALSLLRDEIALGLGLLGCTAPDQVARAHVEPILPYDSPA